MKHGVNIWCKYSIMSWFKVQCGGLSGEVATNWTPLVSASSTSFWFVHFSLFIFILNTHKTHREFCLWEEKKKTYLVWWVLEQNMSKLDLKSYF